jgi:hypothetical protein
VGAEVVERTDATLRGKGYALDIGFERSPRPQTARHRHCRGCRLPAGASRTERLAASAQASGRPVQAAYRMLPPPIRRCVNGFPAFAWVLRNLVRPTARVASVALPADGTGMAFPWHVIAAAPLASGHLVEDLQLGVALALAGTPPLFCQEHG